MKVKDLKVKNLKRLSNKEIKLLNNRIKNELGILNFGFEKKTELYTGIIVLNKEEMKGLKCYFLNKKIIFFEYDNNDGNEHHNRLIPSLHLIIENNNFFVSLPKVVVDVGAIRFVVNGADIMRPGIRTLEEFEQNSLVIVVDEKHNKPLAVTIALFDSNTIRSMSKGRVLENIHFVGDDIWEFKL